MVAAVAVKDVDGVDLVKTEPSSAVSPAALNFSA